ncbi:MAG: PadR family transcriptional regulator [Solirubrobacterales bacterium]
MSLRYMLLGMLLEGPLHGYQMKSSAHAKVFSDFGINDGQLYPALKKMEQEGVIEKTIEQNEKGPNRHVYAITDSGREDFLVWLAADTGEERSFRYDFLRRDPFFARCNYFRHLEPELARTKVKRQIETVHQTIADYQQAWNTMHRRGVDPVRIAILEYGIRVQETRLAWLQDFLALLDPDWTPKR